MTMEGVGSIEININKSDMLVLSRANSTKQWYVALFSGLQKVK